MVRAVVARRRLDPVFTVADAFHEVCLSGNPATLQCTRFNISRQCRTTLAAAVVHGPVIPAAAGGIAGALRSLQPRGSLSRPGWCTCLRDTAIAIRTAGTLSSWVLSAVT